MGADGDAAPEADHAFTSRTIAKNLLEETLDAWGYARTGVIDELENIPASDFAFRPSPHSRTTAELAAHIIESGLMASGELTRKDGNFQRQSYPEFIEEYGGDRAKTRKKGEPSKLLRTTFDEGVAAFRKRGRKRDDEADRAVQRRAGVAADMAQSRDRARGISSRSARALRPAAWTCAGADEVD